MNIELLEILDQLAEKYECNHWDDDPAFGVKLRAAIFQEQPVSDTFWNTFYNFCLTKAEENEWYSNTSRGVIVEAKAAAELLFAYKEASSG